MSAVTGLLFIDANQYLDLYELDKGAAALAAIVEQAGHIFVTRQVADEVQRRKAEVAGRYLKRAEVLHNEALKDAKGSAFEAPGYILYQTSDGYAQLQKQHEILRQRIIAWKDKFKAFNEKALVQIIEGADAISTELEKILCRAVEHTSHELERARQRKERGNPPGKRPDPLGDQISWEQILTHCKGKSRLWIITADADFTLSHGGKLLLNPLLAQEIKRLHPVPEVFCFANIPDGIKHFVETTGVKATKTISPEDAEAIKTQQATLPPPFDWLNSQEQMNAAVMAIMRRSGQPATDAWVRVYQNAKEELDAAVKTMIRTSAHAGAFQTFSPPPQLLPPEQPDK